ncbi:unnamed protein product [Amoebophrya sp. A120]|nr:unnamed protein product [Amoebophrya sp. A120]|eukprot:GSA120T00016018001.1
MKINLDRIPVFLGFLALGILLTTALMQCLDWSYGQAGPLGFFLVVQLQLSTVKMSGSGRIHVCHACLA